MSLPAGDLRHRIKIQRQEQPTDPEYGGPAGPPVWVDVATVRARRTNMLRAAAETVASGGVVAPVQVRFDLRPRQVDPAMRLVGVGGDHDGVVYDIQNVGIANDRSEMAILAVAGASDG